jgi:hypothetical protein
METSVLPITYSSETTGTVLPPEMTQAVGDFAKVLTNHFQKGGEEKMDSKEKTAENPASSMIAYFPSALMGSNLSRFPEGNNISSSSSAEVPNKAPSPGPSTSEPLPKLPPSLPLPDVLNEDQTQSINFDGRYASLQFPNPQEVRVIPPAGSVPSGYGEQGTWVGSALEKERWIPPQSQNSSSEKAAPVIQQQMATSKVMEEGFLSGEMIPEKDSPSNLTVKGGKSIVPAMVGEGINKEGEEKLPLQEEPSPTTTGWSSRTLDPKSPTLEGGMSEKAEKTSLPQREFRAPATAPNSVPPEGASLPESHTQIPTSFSEGNLAGFLEGEGEGQEKVLWMGNESAQFPKREGQKEVDSYETPPVLKEGSTQLPEEVGEVKENSSPAPLKSENPTVAQQVSQRAIWSIRNNEESVRITLDPPQLGHIYMVIERNKEDIKTTLWTDNPATKATLETNQLQIQKIIESEGFKLEKFDVFVQQEKGGFQGSKDDPMNPDPQSRSSPSEIRAPLSGSPDPLPALARAVHPASKYLDLFV